MASRQARLTDSLRKEAYQESFEAFPSQLHLPFELIVVGLYLTAGRTYRFRNEIVNFAQQLRDHAFRVSGIALAITKFDSKTAIFSYEPQLQAHICRSVLPPSPYVPPVHPPRRRETYLHPSGLCPICPPRRDVAARFRRVRRSGPGTGEKRRRVWPAARSRPDAARARARAAGEARRWR